MNATIESIKGRKSTRAYEITPVEKDKLQAVLEAGACAPYGLTLEKRYIIALTGEEQLGKVNNCIGECLRMLPVTDETHPYIKGLVQKAQDTEANFTYGAPVFVVICSNAQNPSAVLDCGAALENMLIAAASLGLGSCWLNQLPRFAQMPPVAGLLKDLDIPEGYAVFGSLCLGYGKNGQERVGYNTEKNVVRIENGEKRKENGEWKMENGE